MPPTSLRKARLQNTLALAVTTGLWLWHRNPVVAGFATAAACLALLAWAAPAWYLPIGRFLDRVAHAILVAFTWASLAIVYFGLFVPMRLWRDWRRRDPLQRDFSPTSATYLLPIPKTPPHFDRQF